jgi:hypothetical protein
MCTIVDIPVELKLRSWEACVAWEKLLRGEYIILDRLRIEKTPIESEYVCPTVFAVYAVYLKGSERVERG